MQAAVALLLLAASAVPAAAQAYGAYGAYSSSRRLSAYGAYGAYTAAPVRTERLERRLLSSSARRTATTPHARRLFGTFDPKAVPLPTRLTTAASRLQTASGEVSTPVQGLPPSWLGAACGV